MTGIMIKCFNTLHEDPDQRYSDQQKVEKLLKAIKCQDSELSVAKLIILLAHLTTFHSRWPESTALTA